MHLLPTSFEGACHLNSKNAHHVGCCIVVQFSSSLRIAILCPSKHWAVLHQFASTSSSLHATTLPLAFYIIMNEPQSRSGFDNDGINGNVLVMPSPGQKKLSSMVLGDGNFEEMMKERSRVSFDVLQRNSHLMPHLYAYITFIYFSSLVHHIHNHTP